MHRQLQSNIKAERSTSLSPKSAIKEIAFMGIRRQDSTVKWLKHTATAWQLAG